MFFVKRHQLFSINPRRLFGVSSRAWIDRQRRDPLVRQAIEQDLRARSAFKLRDIQKEKNIIKPFSNVLDLGAAPGGWSIIASQIIDPSKGGELVGVDLLPLPSPVPNMSFIQGDFSKSDVQKLIRECTRGNAFDVIMSDMLHNTTGQKDTDHFKSLDLVQEVILFALGTESSCSPPMLKVNGTLICKYLKGPDEKDLLDGLRQNFKVVQVLKPKSSRGESREVYFVAQVIK